MNDNISPELHELFDVLNSEVIWLHTIWELYIQFYGTSDKNYEIMNASAPQFFAILKTILFDELVMILNRLTEKATTFGKSNASLEQLIIQMDVVQDAKLITSLKQRLQNIRDSYGAFRTWRDKTLSHNDFTIALQKEARDLPGITRKEAESAICEVDDFMNEFSISKLIGEQDYKPFMFTHGDGSALMQFLERGVESENNEA
jgi:hypothetical protein